MLRQYAWRLFACLLWLYPAWLHADDFEKGMQFLEQGDYAKAFCLWQPLARLGHADAQYNLGWLYANGNGLNVDVEAAVYWWQQAANNGYLDAQFSLGLAYTTGEGIKADLDEAFRWFFMAAKGGHEDAREIVKRLVLESNNNFYTKFPELKQIAWLQQQVTVTGARVNIRSKPSTKGEIVHKADKGDVLTRISHQDDWYEVIYDKNKPAAWIFSSLVKKAR
ncbi:MAG: SH3 domain-containing protein [Chromatiales bacterium]